MFYFLRASVMVSFAVKGGCLAPLANFEAARQGGLADGESPPGRRLPFAARGAGRRLGPQFLKVSNAVRTPAAPSGPYANGAMDDAFSSMVASQAQACAPRPAKAAPSDDSLHATDLDAAKMLGSYAFNAVRGIAMFRRKKK